MRNTYQLECDSFTDLVKRANESPRRQLVLFRTLASKNRYIDLHVSPLIDAPQRLIWKQASSILLFPNGSVIHFGVHNIAADIQKYRGLEFSDIEIDDIQMSDEFRDSLNSLIYKKWFDVFLYGPKQTQKITPPCANQETKP